MARGRPFFSDIARDGIMRYEAPVATTGQAQDADLDEVGAGAKGVLRAVVFRRGLVIASVGFLTERGDLKKAAFLLHQATESLCHCVLLVLTLYGPKIHRITMLRSQAEALHDRLKLTWPSNSKLHRQAFDRLRRAYVEARYFAEYTVSDEELAWLVERVKLLQKAVAAVCQDHLNPAHLSN